MQEGRRQVWHQVGGVHPLHPPYAVVAWSRCRLARRPGREEQDESTLSAFGPFMSFPTSCAGLVSGWGDRRGGDDRGDDLGGRRVLPVVVLPTLNVPLVQIITTST